MKKRYFGIIATALLAVEPFVTAITTPQSSIVQAAGREKVTEVKLTRKPSTFVVQAGSTPSSLSAKRLTGMTSNYGHVTGKYGLFVYPTMDNGDIDYGHRLLPNETLQGGEKYIIIASVEVNNLGGHSFNSFSANYASMWDWEVKSGQQSGYVCQTFPVEVVGRTNKKTIGEDEISNSDEIDTGDVLQWKKEIFNYNTNTYTLRNGSTTQNKKARSSTIKINAHGYVKGKKNAKVRVTTRSLARATGFQLQK